VNKLADLRERGVKLQERLFSNGLMDEDVPEFLPDPVDTVSYGAGYPITGLEKFLGYFDNVLNIANFPSISVTTDFSMAMSACRYDEKPGKDRVIFDGREEGSFLRKASKALEIFKSRYGITGSYTFFIKRYRRYGEAKGLGESAAVASAVSRSLVASTFGKKALQDVSLVSRLARLVSGSGTRSVAGGLSLWLSYPYMKEEYCYGSQINQDLSSLCFSAIPMKSEWVTDSAHKLARSSLFYDQWAVDKFNHIFIELDGGFNLEEILRRSTEDMYMLNSIILSSGNFIHTPSSLAIIAKLKEFTAKNEGLYYTSDTGPTLVLMSKSPSLIRQFLEENSIENHIDGKSYRDAPECSEEFKKVSSDAILAR
jgi:diphosphomevalonate decarboxylase